MSIGLSAPQLYGYESHDEHGKLVKEYRPKQLVVEKGSKDGPVKMALTVVDEESAEGRIPLATPPNGDAIAWERSGHAIHA